MPTFSFEISPDNVADRPPFADRCPRCVDGVTLVPYATTTEGSTLTAFYRHRRCGFQWTCNWAARWSPAWRDAA